MDFRWLCYAVAVSRTGSISMAAKALFTSQPNVSHALKRLEEEVGFPLFLRTPNGVIPTEEGLRFLADVSPIVARFLEVESFYADGPTQSRRVVVSAIDSDVFSQAFLRAFASKIAEEPLYDVSFYETDLEHVLQDVKLGRSALGLVHFPQIVAWNMTRLLEYEKLNFTCIGADCAYLLTREDNPNLPTAPDPSFSWLNRCILVDYDKLYHDKLAFRLTEIPWVQEYQFSGVFHLSDRAMKYTTLEFLPTGVSLSCYLPPVTLRRYHLVQVPCPPVGKIEFGYITREKDTSQWFLPPLLEEIRAILDGETAASSWKV